MSKHFFKILFSVLFVLLMHAEIHAYLPTYVEVDRPFVKILSAPAPTANVLYTSYKGIYFKPKKQVGKYYEITTLAGEVVWINDDDVKEITNVEFTPPSFRIGIVNQIATLEDFFAEKTDPAAPKAKPEPELIDPPFPLDLPDMELPKEDHNGSPFAPSPLNKPYFGSQFQQTPSYYYPELPSDFNLDINGFYEAKLSMRDFSPRDVTDKRFDTIRNDPIYKKLPNNVLVGDPRLDIRYNIAIDGKINDKLSVHYNIEQEPDFPGLYNIVVNYDKTELTFQQFNVRFQSGEFINVEKALDGIKLTSYDDNWEGTFASGRQRSEPIKVETFGTGQQTIPLKNRYILENSERVFFNNSKMTKGADYTIDYFEGKVTFLRVTPQKTDFIKVIYEFTNPIEDFIPVLSRKSFTGAQFKWQQKSRDIVTPLVVKGAETVWPRPEKTSTENIISNQEFKLKNYPIEAGSETVFLNDRKLIRNKHYTIKNKRGTLNLINLQLIETDTLSLTYNYLDSEKMVDTLIGDNAAGGYYLSKGPVVENSEKIYIDDNLVQRIVDYRIDYENKEIIFNYDVPYPSIISVEYNYVKTSVQKADEKESPISVGFTYMKESVNSNEEELVRAATESGLTVSNNIITVSNNPILVSENISVIINNAPANFTVENAYTGQIRILDVVSENATATASYSFQNSFSSTRTFRGIDSRFGNFYTFEEINLLDLPVKYKSISEIRIFGPINGIQEGLPNEFIRLEENIDFIVDYKPNDSDPGVNVAIRFINELSGVTNNVGFRLGNQFPDSNNRMTLFYDFTPQTTADEGNIEQTVFGLDLNGRVTDKWSVGAEIVAAQNNFSKPRITTASVFSGNGQSNFNYSIGNKNLVEDSEIISIENTLGSQLLAKDTDYFINYRNGTIRFKNLTPSSQDTIRVDYQFFDTTTSATAGEAVPYNYATRLNTKFTGEKLKFDAAFRQVDEQFVPIGQIEDAQGTTALLSNIEYRPNAEHRYKLDYLNRAILQNVASAATDESNFLREENIGMESDFPLFKIFENQVKTRYATRIQDQLAGEDVHNIDQRTTDLSFNSHFGPGNFRNTLRVDQTKQESDFLDKVNKVETNVNNFTYSSSIKFTDVAVLGNVSLTPKMYSNISETTRQTAANDKTLRTGYGATSFITPFAGLTNQIQYYLDDVKTEQESVTGNVSKTVNELRNFLYDLSYKPAYWLDTHYRFDRSEAQSPLLNQKGRIQQGTLYEIRKFAPKGLLINRGLSADNGINRFIGNSFFAYNIKIDQVQENDRRRIKETISDSLSFNEFLPLKGVKLNKIYVSNLSSDSTDIINSTTVSTNIFEQKRLTYGGNLTVESNWPILKHFAYTLDIQEEEETLRDRSISNSATSNITIQDNPLTKRFQKLRLKPDLLGKRLNKLFRRRLGEFNLSAEESLERDINSRISTNFRGSTQETPFLTEDSREISKYIFNSDYAPLNLFNTNSDLLLSDEKFFRENAASSASGSIFKNIANLGFGTGFKPLKRLALNTVHRRDRVQQYRSNSVNANINSIKDTLGTFDTPVGNTRLESRSDSDELKLTYTPFHFVDFSGGARETKITEEFSTSNVSLDEVQQIAALLGITYRPARNWSLSLDGEFKTTQQNGNDSGKSETFTGNTRYSPIKTRNFSVELEYNIAVTTGEDINRLDKNIQESGTGAVLRTVVTEQNNTTQTGLISVNIIFPLIDSPYIDNFTLTAEGHIKSIQDKINDDNSYDITGIVLKGVLNF